MENSNMKEGGFNCPLSLFLHIKINKILKESWFQY